MVNKQARLRIIFCPQNFRHLVLVWTEMVEISDDHAAQTEVKVEDPEGNPDVYPNAGQFCRPQV